jgi:TonB family protein
MANSGRDTAGSQFYIVKKESPGLDNGQYTLFGKVTAGMDIVDKLVKGDRILSATVEAPQMGPTRRAEADNLAYPLLPDDAPSRPFTRTVRVKVRIGAQGGVAKATLVKGSGDKDIDAAILEALGAWRWSAALVKGEPVASEQEFTYDLATHSRRYD